MEGEARRDWQAAMGRLECIQMTSSLGGRGRDLADSSMCWRVGDNTPPGMCTGKGVRSPPPLLPTNTRNRVYAQVVHSEGLYDAVLLPYKGGKFFALAVLPAQGVGLAEVIKGMTGDHPQVSCTGAAAGVARNDPCAGCQLGRGRG